MCNRYRIYFTTFDVGSKIAIQVKRKLSRSLTAFSCFIGYGGRLKQEVVTPGAPPPVARATVFCDSLLGQNHGKIPGAFRKSSNVVGLIEKLFTRET